MSQNSSNINHLFISGNCAQTSFLTLHSMLQGIFDFETKHTLRALAPFPAIAMSGGTCGAVVGCIAAIGLIYSKEGGKYVSWTAYLNSLSPARKFCRDFEKQLGGVLCGDIMKSEFKKRYNLEDTDQASEWINNGATEKCGKVILKAVKIASEIILAQ
jgi:C_GCAxxG_C_C family probable redox protein